MFLVYVHPMQYVGHTLKMFAVDLNSSLTRDSAFYLSMLYYVKNLFIKTSYKLTVAFL